MDIITRTLIKKNDRESFFVNYHLSLPLIISLLKRRVSVSYNLYNIPGFLLLLSSYNINNKYNKLLQYKYNQLFQHISI